MGFYFTKPTTFKQPLLLFGKIDHYAVDHSPSYFWESTSKSISEVLVVHVPSVINGRGK
ncbi:MAG: N5-(carboxyethyl)ornithine synthase [Cyclobacteriaceae bacterium]|jgi:N5-(carboxyethyl)ornithine synthase